MFKMNTPALVAGYLLIGLQLVLSYFNGYLTQDQIAGQRGGEKGLPFLAHGQMWTDAIIVTPLVAWIIAYYSEQWLWSDILLAGIIGFLISVGLHCVYEMSKIPGCHAHDGNLSPAGWVHFVYQGAALAVLLLYYFSTVSDERSVIAVSGLLVAHLLVGAIQIPLYLGTPLTYWINVLQIVAGPVAILVGAIYAWTQLP